MEPIQALRSWLNTAQAKKEIHDLGGYETAETGSVKWVY
jgi:hypothetical protein